MTVTTTEDTAEAAAVRHEAEAVATVLDVTPVQSERIGYVRLDVPTPADAKAVAVRLGMPVTSVDADVYACSWRMLDLTKDDRPETVVLVIVRAVNP